MSRYRLAPSREQEATLRRHCADARFVWNLCVEQQSWWRRDRGKMPGFAERCRQLTEARAGNPWLARGSVIVQQQAIRDFVQTMANFFNGTHGRPTWRKVGRGEGFRIVAIGPGDVRRLNRNWAEMKIPKVGWVRFRWSRVEDLRIQSMTRSARGSIETPGRNITQKAGLNREIKKSGWGLLVRRLEGKAPGRVEKVPPAFTSQRCSACGHIAAESRESQALFRCVACGYASNADVNAACNIAAGHAVKARGGDGNSQPVNREPQHTLLAS